MPEKGYKPSKNQLAMPEKGWSNVLAQNSGAIVGCRNNNEGNQIMANNERKKWRERRQENKIRNEKKEALKKKPPINKTKYYKSIENAKLLDFCYKVKNSTHTNTTEPTTKSNNNFNKIWNQFDWTHINRIVLNVQTCIYKLSLSNNPNDLTKMRKIQEGLLQMPEAKLLATRRVTQDNSGKKTAGPDGIANLDKKQSLALAMHLQLTSKSDPIRRVWVPKPGTEEKRPLGIPNIIDRARQALAKLALEPEWEAKFEPTSYGFRPKRRAQDGIKNLYNIISRANRWILDADIEKCFDRINHTYLLNKLNLPKESIMSKQLEAWLKAGIIEVGNPFATYSETGTPQGGIISPLLANIALHGMMEAAAKAVESVYGKQAARKYMHIIRYADDFVVTAKGKEQIEKAKEGITDFLAEVGLNFKEAKTRILDTTPRKGVDNSFNFLGMKFKQIRLISKYKLIKINKHSVTDLKCMVIPNKKAVDKHFDKISSTLKVCRTTEDVVTRLSPIIRGWVNYFSYSNARTYGQVGKWNTQLYKKLSNWVYRTYKTRKKLTTVWTTVKGDTWCFYYTNDKGVKTTLYTYGKGRYSITKYFPVKGIHSPYDGTDYWDKRILREMKNELHQKLLVRQKNICPICKKSLLAAAKTEERFYHIDHIKRRASGGDNKISNLQLVHVWCHYAKTAAENAKT